MANPSTKRNANTNPQDLVRYARLLGVLSNVYHQGAITKEEAEAIKAQLMKNYGVVSDWGVGRKSASKKGSKL
jgi:membrane peptidoglycan carboxypeptidase